MTDVRAFRGFRFPAEVVLWAVGWHLRFPVSYRDLERMLAGRGVEAMGILAKGQVRGVPADAMPARRAFVHRIFGLTA